MATATTNIATPAPAPTQAAQANVPSNRRLVLLRSWMLALVSASLAFGALAGIVAWQGNVATYNDYHTIVSQGSVSVDAALRARAASLDHMSAAATYLETTGQTQQDAANRATSSWSAYSNQSRVSWSNITDPRQGEQNVFASADNAASSYIQQIGSMFGYSATGDRDKAGAAFLAARETMNTRLVPALTGLESVKVELMEATYAGADTRINRWRDATLLVGSILALIFLAMFWAVRRMHYRWSSSIGIAFIVTVLLTAGLQWQLGQASSDARVLVREAYDNVAGVQDLAALLSQERALDSIVVFNPQAANVHLASFEQYNTLVEQRLCGPRDCTLNSFLSADDTISPGVIDAAAKEQIRLGLPNTPLVANVYFRGQAARYETLRQDYRNWLTAHNKIKQQVEANDLKAAAATSTGESAEAFAALGNSADAATTIARTEFDNIWKRVYTLSGIGEALALAFPLSGLLAATGLWRRRNELLG